MMAEEWDFGFPREIVDCWPHHRNRAKDVADLLVIAFKWQETLEGHRFWQDISDRLERIARRGY